MANKDTAFTLWFDEVSIEDIPYVGGKNASLGEMYQNLTNAKHPVFKDEQIKVPYGYAVTAYAYKYFIEQNNLDGTIRELIEGCNIHDVKDLQKTGEKVRNLILGAKFPKDLEDDILKAHKEMAEKMGTTPEKLDLAVRSSATAEDLPDASFAGQQESYLNVHGTEALLDCIRAAFSSLFTNRAISYRQDQGFDHFKVQLSVAVQKMARSDKCCSGVMFTLDTDSGFRNVVVINGSWGLGEYIVKGIVSPDEFVVFKPTLREGYKSIINKKLGAKERKLIYSGDIKNPTKEAEVTEADKKRFVLPDDIIVKLAKWGCIIEDHYKKPMDIEWAWDGEELNIVQARPETVESRKNALVLEDYQLLETGKVLTQGTAVGGKIGTGKTRFIKSPEQLSEFQKGEILVAEITDPDWEPIMKIASAIVANSGGRTSHAAIVSRELGIPAIVGCGDATKALKDGTMVTVSCAEGETGKVYEGELKYKVHKTDLTNFEAPKTKIKMIVADAELVFNTQFIPNRGVGLAREEFVITNFIKVHPNALINYDKIKDKEVKAQIDKLTAGYEDKVQYYVDKLAYGLSIIASAFYPHEVIVRFSDFKTNEYATLLGGSEYEPKEENPMMGWRGASRYYDPNFEEAFALECKAVKKAREEMGLYNLQVMIPFCRTPEEAKKVIAVMEKNGLEHTKIKDAREVANSDNVDKRLRVWCMAEIPANILLVDEFAEMVDGFSIGSNDLTQLTLGLDRDSKYIAHIGNEKNGAVVKLIKMLIKRAHELGLPVGICGQGPSDFPDFAEFLVREGIDSMALQPDSVLKTSIAIKKLEDELKK